MLKNTLMVCVAAVMMGCGDSICDQADMITTACLSSSAEGSDDIECADDSRAACEAQCTIDQEPNMCNLLQGLADPEVQSAYDQCLTACEAIKTEKTEE